MNQPHKLEIREIKSSESSYVHPDWETWRTFKHPVLQKYSNPIASVAFSPNEPHRVMIAEGTQIHLFDVETREFMKTISKFNTPCHGLQYRSDGEVFGAGGEDGVCMILRSSNQGQLRMFKGHKAPVYTTNFLGLKNIFVSGSDDQTVKCWDIGLGEEVYHCIEHQDSVRCTQPFHSEGHLFISGSYDHTIKCWDIRSPAKRAVFTIDTEKPVETLVVNQRGSTIICGSGNEVKCYDVMSGGKLLQRLSNHQKTITHLHYSGDYSKLFSCGLDHMVKIYDCNTFQVIHTMKYDAPILSMGLSKADDHIMVGMNDGYVSWKLRKVTVKEEKVVGKKRKIEETVTPYDLMIMKYQNRRQKLQPFEEKLKRHQYKTALEEALKMNHPLTTFSLLSELGYRGVMDYALQGWQDNELVPLLNYFVQAIGDPQFNKLMVKVVQQFLGLYEHKLGWVGNQGEVYDLLKELKRKTAYQASLHIEYVRMQAMLHTLIGSDLT